LKVSKYSSINIKSYNPGPFSTKFLSTAILKNYFFSSSDTCVGRKTKYLILANKWPPTIRSLLIRGAVSLAGDKGALGSAESNCPIVPSSLSPSQLFHFFTFFFFSFYITPSLEDKNRAIFISGIINSRG
jgi:hypothetical protein